MIDDDSNSGFEMISSQPDKDSFEYVPDDRKYKFKIISRLEVGPKKVGYLLKKGLMLPYTTNSGGCSHKLNIFKMYIFFYSGFEISFSKSLEPSVTGYSGSDVGGMWEMLECESANICVETSVNIEVATAIEGDLTALLALVESAASEYEDRFV